MDVPAATPPASVTGGPMIVIRDQQLRLLVLAQIIRELQKDSHGKAPPPAGFTAKQVEDLRALTTDELVKLSEMTEPRVAVPIHPRPLHQRLGAAAQPPNPPPPPPALLPPPRPPHH